MSRNDDIKTIIDKVNGTRVRIVVDHDPIDPRSYEPVSILKIDKVNDRYFGARNERPEIRKDEDGNWFGAEVIIELPLNVHCHGGVAFSIGSGSSWDNWQCGVVLVTVETAVERFGVSTEEARTPEFIERVKASAVAEVAEFSAWANGEVYGFIAESIDHQTKEVIDEESCYGFYSTQKAEEHGIEAAKRLRQQPMLPGLAA